MNIFEILSFDFGAFITSTPGIMIIVGIVLLLVAVVFLVLDKKKNAKNNEVGPAVEESTEAKEQEPVATPEVTPEVTGPVVVVASEGDGVKEVPVAVEPEVVNFTEPPAIDMATAPVLEKLVIEELPTASAPVENLNAEPVVTKETPTVYGGATPESTVNVSLEEKPREIYGGASPLENTAPIPSKSVKEAYQGTLGVEKPTVTETLMTPEVKPEVATTPVVPAEAPKVETLAKPQEEEIEKLEF